MNKIIISLQPFDLLQKIFVYDEESKLLSSDIVSEDKLINLTHGLVSRFNVKEIYLNGNQAYLEKYQAELKTRFTGSEVEIKII